MPDVTIDSLAALLRYCDEFSKQMLAEAGEFQPFAAFINQDGKVEAVGANTGEEHPRGSAVYQLLEDAMASMAMERKALACAIAADVNVPSTLSSPFADGVRVHVEAPGYSRLVFTPYKVLSHRTLRKFMAVLPTVEYAEPIAVDVPAKLFANAEG
jgi:hypothetical protein